MRLRLTALFMTLLMSAAPAAPAPQPVEIPLASGVLHAQLYKPEGAGPFPTVIALHGCGGLGGHSDSVLPRYRDWAERLLKAGNAVLWPDSYGSRELGPQCRVKEMHVKARRERVADIAAARAWLVKQSWVARDRVSLMGWANGASALLWAVRPQSAARDLGPDFRAAIAFYPDCRISAGLGWSTRVPTLVLIGADDDVSSPPACRQMVEGAHGRSALARIVVYPGAYHDFDTPLHAAAGSNDATAPERGISAPMRRRARNRRKMSRNGWRGDGGTVARMSAAISGEAGPAYRCAHAGYTSHIKRGRPGIYESRKAPISARDGALVRPRCRLNAIPMRSRIVLFSALVVFTVAIFLYEAHAGAPQRAPDHCGFWTTIDAGLSCR